MSQSALESQKITIQEIKKANANSSIQTELHNRQVSNLSGFNASEVPRLKKKIVHYENPRKYINFDQNQAQGIVYQNQQIAYGQGALTTGGSCNCCTITRVCANPTYRYKAVNDFEVKKNIENQNQLEELIRKLVHLEHIHKDEISKLKYEFERERINYDKLLSEKRVEIQERIIQVPSDEKVDKEELIRLTEEVRTLKISLNESQHAVSTFRQQLEGKELIIVHLKETNKTQELLEQINELTQKRETLIDEYHLLKETHIVKTATDKTLLEGLGLKLETSQKELDFKIQTLSELQIKLFNAEKDGMEVRILRDSVQKADLSLEESKRKKKELKILLKELLSQLHARDEELKEIRLLLIKKEEEIKILSYSKIHSSPPIREKDDLEQQNQYLINQLGKLTEEYQILEKNGRIIEKPVYVETVKNVTTVKEIPAKIEERTVYVQDTQQLERLQAVIQELHQEISILTEEKNQLILNFQDEKKNWLNKMAILQQQQLKQHQSQVIKEVVIEKQIDRSELSMMENRLRDAENHLANEKIKNAQLLQQLNDLKIELSRYQINYKLVKQPNAYRLEHSFDHQSSLMHQYQIVPNTQLNLSGSPNIIRWNATGVSSNVIQKEKLSSSQIIHRNQEDVQYHIERNQENLQEVEKHEDK